MTGCYNKIELDEAIDKVWQRFTNFHDLSWAPEVVTSVEKVGDIEGDQVGARRILNDVFHETLTELNPQEYSLSYTIDDGPGPVAKDTVKNYVGNVKLSANGDGTLVEWSSTFESQDEKQVQDFCNPIYRSLLTALKSNVDG
ncbi:SRPBCC family protein [Aliikangiella sp. G2MR2-5]|uniref:SRPBCC family protein n=1 Tax=Aliikangiella sp. G2MR2-5 TaxID=2788943 RepID=UPI0018A91EE5|nr:SRPBCC family protein [Aliikangiella sp. G2MR2-5]